jgi:Cu/Ag efflux protein CusF
VRHTIVGIAGGATDTMMWRAIAAIILLALASGAWPTPAAAQPADPPKLFHGVGVVTAVDAAAGRLTINHQAIAGLMPAMEMSLGANPPTLVEGVRPGDKIEFDIESKTYIVRAVKVVGRAQ